MLLPIHVFQHHVSMVPIVLVWAILLIFIVLVALIEQAVFVNAVLNTAHAHLHLVSMVVAASMLMVPSVVSAHQIWQVINVN